MAKNLSTRVFDTAAEIRQNAGAPLANALITELNSEVYWDKDSVETDDGLFVFKVTSQSTGRWKKVFRGSVRAKEAGIKTDGTSQTTALGTLLSLSRVKEIAIDDGDVTLTGTLTVPSKRIRFKNGSKLIGGTIIGAFISAEPDAIVFSPTTVVGALLNYDLYASWFGFLPTNSAIDNTIAISKISACINAMGGGVRLIFDSNTYTVGKESFAGVSGLSYSYLGTPLFSFHNNTKEIVLEGNGATLKMADGMHFGSFSPISGASVNPNTVINHTGGYAIGSGITMTIVASKIAMTSGTAITFPNNALFTLTAPVAEGATTITGNLTVAAVADGASGGYVFTDYNYAAYPESFIDVRNNKAIVIRDINIDGNIPNLVIGGRWGDDGIQLPADGILSFDNDSITIDNVRSIHCGRDGVVIVNAVASVATPKKFVNLLNTVIDGNARQGLSIVGCNHLNMDNVQLINTGKTFNTATGAAVRSSPAAGIDLEQETGFIKDGYINNIFIYNNDGAGLLIAGNVGEFKIENSKIIGTTTWSIYGSPPSFIFNNCVILGSMVNMSYPVMNNCTLSMEAALSPNGQVYGTYMGDFGGGGGVDFRNCIIDGAAFSAGILGDSIYTNTHIKRIGAYSLATGTFNGNNTMEYGSGDIAQQPDHPNASNSIFNGSLIINGRERKPTSIEYDNSSTKGQVKANWGSAISINTDDADRIIIQDDGKIILPDFAGSGDILLGVHNDGELFKANSPTKINISYFKQVLDANFTAIVDIWNDIATKVVPTAGVWQLSGMATVKQNTGTASTPTPFRLIDTTNDAVIVSGNLTPDAFGYDTISLSYLFEATTDSTIIKLQVKPVDNSNLQVRAFNSDNNQNASVLSGFRIGDYTP